LGLRKANNYTLLTFDEDFVELLNLYGYPPKIIWLGFGNLGTLQIAQRLMSSETTIIDFLCNLEAGILEIY
jgi:predicted nuclease of predicted toxin-antitoxin system